MLTNVKSTAFLGAAILLLSGCSKLSGGQDQMSWAREALQRNPQLEVVATDERRQSEALGREGKLATSGPFHADLAELVSGKAPGRRDQRERAFFVFAGDALADLAAAHAVYKAALQRGLGVRLPQ